MANPGWVKASLIKKKEKREKGNSKFQTSAEERVQSPKHGDESTVGTLTPTASHCRRVLM